MPVPFDPGNYADQRVGRPPHRVASRNTRPDTKQRHRRPRWTGLRRNQKTVDDAFTHGQIDCPGCTDASLRAGIPPVPADHPIGTFAAGLW